MFLLFKIKLFKKFKYIDIQLETSVGTIKFKRKEIPNSVKDAKPKKGEVRTQKNMNELQFLNYKDKKII